MATVIYGATGTPATATFTLSGPGISISTSHAIAAGDNCVIADVMCAFTNATTPPTPNITSVTYGGVAMTPVAAAGVTAQGVYKLAIWQFYLLDPPSGAQTVTATGTLSGANPTTNSSVAIQTVSYAGVGTVSGFTQNTPATTTSNSVTSSSVPSGSMAHFAHMNSNISTAFSAYNRTSRSAFARAPRAYFLVGDAGGSGATVISTATQGTSTNIWRAVSCLLTASTAPPEASAGTSNYGWASSAVGAKTPKGVGAGSYTWAGAAVGQSVRRAATSGNYLWTAQAIGKRTSKAATSGNYNWTTGSVGDANYQGQASGGYTFVGTATGYTPVDAPTGRGDYGWLGSAAGYSRRSATVDAAYMWASTIVGKRVPKAPAEEGDYAFAASAAGKRPAKAVAGGAYAVDLDDAIGFRTGSAFAAGGYRWVGLATGLFVPHQPPGEIGWYAE